MNVTPLRLSILRFLASKPGGYSLKGVVQECCPRNTRSGAWTEQGAARMAGKLFKPLREAGLVRDRERDRMCYRQATITDAGRALLAEHDAAASRAELDRAISSGS